jgi:hypothetical protein
MPKDPCSLQCTIQAYKTILEIITSTHSCLTLDSLQGTSKIPQKTCYIRHDVDLSPEQALKIAILESSLHVNSTYYVLLGSPFYNVLDATVSDFFKEILALGHEIGLHFDPNRYRGLSPTSADWESRLNEEACILERECKTKVRSFSFHNPRVGNWDQCDKQLYQGLLNGSWKELRQLQFYGDSGGTLTKGPFNTFHSNVKPDESLYVLTHADWWRETDSSIEDKINQASNEQKNRALRYWEHIVTSVGGKIKLV